jgi:hypothetical protein
MRHPMTAVIVAGICLSSPLAADAQDWHGILGDIADRAAHKAADKALDKATQSAPPSGSNSSNESNGSNGANGADTQPGTSASQPGASGAAAGQGAAPGSFKSYQNYDFVPGDKIVFDDDFHTDTDGEFPAHWKLLKGQGVVNLMQGAPVFALTEGNYVEVEPRVRTRQLPVRLVHRRMAALSADSALKLEIDGHTDSDGDSAKNLALSSARAAAVRKVLIDQGVDGSRLIAKGFGASKPLDSNSTPEGKANNRRVELVKV